MYIIFAAVKSIRAFKETKEGGTKDFNPFTLESNIYAS